jgi:hypothetical protein
MPKSVIIKLTTAGTSTGPFNLLSDYDSYVSPFETNKSKATLVTGYTSSLVPNTATIVRVLSSGSCTNYVDLPISGSVTTTSTTTSTTTLTTSNRFRVGNNNSTDGVIDSITPAFYTITVGSIPVGPSTLARGTHSTQTGLVISGYVTAQTGGGNISLYINTVLIECINMPYTGISNLYTFSSVSFIDTDLVEIILNDGICL